jgi:serine/threonine-protein kinase
MGHDTDGTVYLVLERLEGESLATRLTRTARLSAAEAYAVLVPVMRALAFAHRKGVVHRDIKPDNIYISSDPEHGDVPKLLDFGIAKVLNSERGSSNTRTGTIMGTAEYMSPEQARGLSDIGPASDVWSIGVVWYECLAGVVPFEGANATGVILSIVDGRFEPLAHRAPQLASPLVDAVEGSLVVDRGRRHPDMAAFLEELDRARGAVGLPPDATGRYRGADATGARSAVPAAACICARCCRRARRARCSCTRCRRRARCSCARFRRGSGRARVLGGARDAHARAPSECSGVARAAGAARRADDGRTPARRARTSRVGARARTCGEHPADQLRTGTVR